MFPNGPACNWPANVDCAVKCDVSEPQYECCHAHDCQQCEEDDGYCSADFTCVNEGSCAVDSERLSPSLKFLLPVSFSLLIIVPVTTYISCKVKASKNVENYSSAIPIQIFEQRSASHSSLRSINTLATLV